MYHSVNDTGTTVSHSGNIKPDPYLTLSVRKKSQWIKVLKAKQNNRVRRSTGDCIFNLRNEQFLKAQKSKAINAKFTKIDYIISRNCGVTNNPTEVSGK